MAEDTGNIDKLRILFLTPRFPFPLIGGDRVKPYYIMSHLAQKHEITLVSFFHGGTAPKSYVREVENLGVRVFDIPLLPMNAAMRTASRMFGRLPLEVLFYTQKEFRERVDELLTNEKFDLGFSFFMRTAEYLKDAPIKKILMAEDCRTLYQRRSFEKSASLKQKIVRLWEHKKLRSYEPEIVNHFDATTFVTRRDIDSMTEMNPDARYRLLTNGTDLNKFKPLEKYEDREGILFAGKLDVWANVLMVRQIVNEIFPRIKQKVRDVHLDIVGANPGQYILSLEKRNIKVTANVPEMQPFLQRARLFLHPHIGGSGIQNKLLEAMACGCPVVTTPTGIQGIPARNGFEVLIGRTADELVKHSIKLLNNPDFAEEISFNARRVIEENHDWPVIFNQCDRIIEEVMNT
ncbi:MAG: glycosyltransferase [Candidatus Kapaibacterium sp.]